MNRSFLPRLGRGLLPAWRRRLKRELLLWRPSLYATDAIRYEQSLACEEEAQALLSKLDGTLDVPGDIIECGCFLCGTTVRMARHLQQRHCRKRIYACDTFTGFDPPEFHRDRRSGEASAERDYAENDFTYVQRKLKRLGVADEVTLVKGLFQETLARLSGPFSFAFIDCDLHDSMLYAARTLWPHLSVGGCCVFDDYDNDSFRGATRAVDTLVREQAHTIGERGPLADKLYFAYKDRD